jgi:hypothetical protein
LLSQIIGSSILTSRVSLVSGAKEAPMHINN